MYGARKALQDSQLPKQHPPGGGAQQNQDQSSKSTSGGSKSAPHASKSAASKPTAPASKHAPPASKHAHPASKYANPASKYAHPASKYAHPASKYAHPASKRTPPAPKHAPPASKHAHPASKHAPPAPKHAPPASKHAPPASKHAPPSSTRNGWKPKPFDEQKHSTAFHKQSRQLGSQFLTPQASWYVRHWSSLVTATARHDAYMMRMALEGIDSRGKVHHMPQSAAALHSPNKELQRQLLKRAERRHDSVRNISVVPVPSPQKESNKPEYMLLKFALPTESRSAKENDDGSDHLADGDEPIPNAEEAVTFSGRFRFDVGDVLWLSLDFEHPETAKRVREPSDALQAPLLVTNLRATQPYSAAVLTGGAPPATLPALSHRQLFPIFERLTAAPFLANHAWCTQTDLAPTIAPALFAGLGAAPTAAAHPKKQNKGKEDAQKPAEAIVAPGKMRVPLPSLFVPLECVVEECTHVSVSVSVRMPRSVAADWFPPQPEHAHAAYDRDPRTAGTHLHPYVAALRLPTRGHAALRWRVDSGPPTLFTERALNGVVGFANSGSALSQLICQMRHLHLYKPLPVARSNTSALLKMVQDARSVAELAPLIDPATLLTALPDQASSAVEQALFRRLNQLTFSPQSYMSSAHTADDIVASADKLGQALAGDYRLHNAARMLQSFTTDSAAQFRAASAGAELTPVEILNALLAKFAPVVAPRGAAASAATPAGDTSAYINNGTAAFPSHIDSMFRPQDNFAPLPEAELQRGAALLELALALDDSQRRAIVDVLSRTLSVIQGPPGTGKTQTIAHLVWLWVSGLGSVTKAAASRDEATLPAALAAGERVYGGRGRILVSAFSNTAVNVIAERIITMPGCGKDETINIVRVGKIPKNSPIEHLSVSNRALALLKKRFPDLLVRLEDARVAVSSVSELLTKLSAAEKLTWRTAPPALREALKGLAVSIAGVPYSRRAFAASRVADLVQAKLAHANADAKHTAVPLEVSVPASVVKSATVFALGDVTALRRAHAAFAAQHKALAASSQQRALLTSAHAACTALHRDLVVAHDLAVAAVDRVSRDDAVASDEAAAIAAMAYSNMSAAADELQRAEVALQSHVPSAPLAYEYGGIATALLMPGAYAHLCKHVEALHKLATLQTHERAVRPLLVAFERELAAARAPVPESLSEGIFALAVGMPRLPAEVGSEAAVACMALVEKRLKDAQLRFKLVRNEYDRKLKELQKKVVENADIVLATCVGAGQKLITSSPGKYSLVIIDEASQAPESSVTIPLALAAKDARAVLVGDQCQLPPTSRAQRLHIAGATTSLFERLLAPSEHAPAEFERALAPVSTCAAAAAAAWLSHAPAAVNAYAKILAGGSAESQRWIPRIYQTFMAQTRARAELLSRAFTNTIAPSVLRVQYRMHAAISAWPSRQLYDGRVADGVTPHARRPPPGFPWLLLSRSAAQLARDAASDARAETGLIGAAFHDMYRGQAFAAGEEDEFSAPNRSSLTAAELAAPSAHRVPRAAQSAATAGDFADAHSLAPVVFLDVRNHEQPDQSPSNPAEAAVVSAVIASLLCARAREHTSHTPKRSFGIFAPNGSGVHKERLAPLAGGERKRQAGIVAGLHPLSVGVTLAQAAGGAAADPVASLTSAIGALSLSAPACGSAPEAPLSMSALDERLLDFLGPAVQASEIGVVCPYSGQVRHMQHQLEKLQHAMDRHPSLRPRGQARSIDVQSVDGFQGREKEVIILSCTRSNVRGSLGFVQDVRRLNVAVTRAKRGLVVVGNAALLSTHATWRSYLSYLDARGLVVDAREVLRRASGLGAELPPVRVSSELRPEQPSDSAPATPQKPATNVSLAERVGSSQCEVPVLTDLPSVSVSLFAPDDVAL